MATATNRKPRKPAPTTLRLSITIGPTSYAVRPLAADPGSGVSKLFRLRRSDGTAYHVSRHAHGCECDCADFTFRRDGLDPAGCKHIRALVAVGLVEPTPPARPAASAWPDWTDEVRYGVTNDAAAR